MLASQHLNLKTLNAYTATSPGAFADYWWDPNEKTRLKWLKAMPLAEDTLYVITNSIGVNPVSGK
jgi:hypothetical protein